MLAHNEEEQGYLVADMAIAPPLLITGVWESTSAEKPFSYYADLIRNRNFTNPTQQDVNAILAAMDRCFRLPEVKKMSKSTVFINFGPPDRIIIRSAANPIYVYQVKHAPNEPERWLVYDRSAKALPLK